VIKKQTPTIFSNKFNKYLSISTILVERIYKVSSVHICSMRILIKKGTSLGKFLSSDFTPHYWNKILKEIMECSMIQHKNVNRGYAATIIATNVQNCIPFDEHKPGDVSIHQLPHRQLSAVCQTRPHSDAAAVGLSKVSKVIQSGLCLSFC